MIWIWYDTISVWERSTARKGTELWLIRWCSKLWAKSICCNRSTPIKQPVRPAGWGRLWLLLTSSADQVHKIKISRLLIAESGSRCFLNLFNRVVETCSMLVWSCLLTKAVFQSRRLEYLRTLGASSGGGGNKPTVRVPPLQVRLVELYCETTLEGLDDVKFEDVAWWDHGTMRETFSNEDSCCGVEDCNRFQVPKHHVDGPETEKTTYIWLLKSSCSCNSLVDVPWLSIANDFRTLNNITTSFLSSHNDIQWPTDTNRYLNV